MKAETPITARPLGHMNFRLVWVGSDQDPDEHPRVTEARVAVPPPPCGTVRYERRGSEMVRRQQLRDGALKITTVTNFSARIVGDLILDDDADPRRHFEVEAEVGGQKISFVLPSAEFGRMGWVLRQLGPQAVIYPGQQQHARVAIQQLSGPVQPRQ